MSTRNCRVVLCQDKSLDRQRRQEERGGEGRERPRFCQAPPNTARVRRARADAAVIVNTFSVDEGREGSFYPKLRAYHRGFY